jgi:hypothetical protein
MTDKYRIDPNFVVPEPTAAKYFCTMTEEEFANQRESFFDHWRKEGVKQVRVTIVNDEYPHEPYPHGVWLEGWDDPNARMLPFGEAEGPDGPIWPPLTYANGNLAVKP